MRRLSVLVFAALVLPVGCIRLAPPPYPYPCPPVECRR